MHEHIDAENFIVSSVKKRVQTFALPGFVLPKRIVMQDDKPSRDLSVVDNARP